MRDTPDFRYYIFYKRQSQVIDWLDAEVKRLGLKSRWNMDARDCPSYKKYKRAERRAAGWSPLPERQTCVLTVEVGP